MKHLIATLAVATFFSSTTGWAQNAERFFIGEPQYVSGEGQTRYCAIPPENRQLRLHLAGGYLSNLTNNCRVQVQADGNYTGRCDTPDIIRNIRGRIIGDTIDHYTKNVGNSTVCEYHTVLKRTR
jgi:hypothetical protein